MGYCVPEFDLHDAWLRADGSRVRVYASDGRGYRILYSGMPGGSVGPDFRDAVLETEDGAEVAGDVEIHSRAMDWYAHQHDRDARYCNVVFHAVGAPSQSPSPSQSDTPDEAMNSAPNSAINSWGMVLPEVDIGFLLNFKRVEKFGERFGSGASADG